MRPSGAGVRPAGAGARAAHLSGADDGIVPAAIAQRFATAAGGACTQLRTLPQLRHDGDWASLWPGLLLITPRCLAPHPTLP